jgi:glycosyltransferase involved in cell wall biosynthesis
VFFNFDYTAYARKNPESAVRAFASAFSGEGNTVLVFKTVKGKVFNRYRQALLSVVKEVGLQERFIEISDYIPLSDVYALTASCDVYLSLHRGEGFGLGIAEAMSLGKPVVVSDYSSTTEFCKKDNACLVPCKMVKPTAGECEQIPYSWAITEWAEPDIQVAAKWLVALYRDEKFRTDIGKSARKFIKTYFSDNEFKKSIFDCLRNYCGVDDCITVKG